MWLVTLYCLRVRTILKYYNRIHDDIKFLSRWRQSMNQRRFHHQGFIECLDVNYIVSNSKENLFNSIKRCIIEIISTCFTLQRKYITN